MIHDRAETELRISAVTTPKFWLTHGRRISRLSGLRTRYRHVFESRYMASFWVKHTEYELREFEL